MVRDSKVADVKGRDGTVADRSWKARVSIIHNDLIWERSGG